MVINHSPNSREIIFSCKSSSSIAKDSKGRDPLKIIPSKLEVAPHALKMSEWVSGVEWMDTP